jgi:4-amino-4-deoxy-L-arabinose transferase-like glycosyltransferase
MGSTSMIKTITNFCKNNLSNAKKWVRENPTQALLLIIILLVGAFLRLYKIDQYMTFLGDEGRDVIVVRRLLVNFDIILVGPGTSIGNMYLGPLYYYMMAPALLLANFSPVGPAAMIALLGVATIFFVWFIAREWFGSVAAIVAASLYTVSPTVITYSRSSLFSQSIRCGGCGGIWNINGFL